MDITDTLSRGHNMVLDIISEVPESERDTPGVVGIWSVREIIAHLASHEEVLAEILTTFLSGGPTPGLDMMNEDSLHFNHAQVEMRKDKTSAELLAEYEDWHEKVMSLIVQIPKEMYRSLEKTLPWQGGECTLEELVIYTNYAHKREHCAQIGVFVDQLKTR